MVDLRPLVFINLLAVMFFFTAGFADFQRSGNDLDIPGLITAPHTDSKLPSQNSLRQKVAAHSSNNPPAKQEATGLSQFSPNGELKEDSLENAILFADQLSDETSPTESTRETSIRDSTEIKQSEQSQSADNTLVASLEKNLLPSPAQQTLDEAVKEKAALAEPSPSPKTGRLVVRSNLNQDEVMINGLSYGPTPVTLDLPPNGYEIEVKKAGYRTWSNQLNLQRGTEVTLRAQLKKATRVEYYEGVWKNGTVTGQGSYSGLDGSRYGVSDPCGLVGAA